MKKRRISSNSIATKENVSNIGAGEKIYCSVRSLDDIPHNLLVMILLKLSVKRVIVCKRVCKTWRDLISDPEFAKLHFGQSETYPLVRTSDPKRVSRILYLLQDERCQNFNLEFDCKCVNFSNCEHKINMKLDAKLKFPLRNINSVVNDNRERMKNYSQGMAKRNPCIKVRPREQRYDILNSCNGLFCLSEPIRRMGVAVCNPVTGEFVKLPDPQIPDPIPGCRSYVNCGLGYSPKSNHYKVVVMYRNEFWIDRKAQVYTLGNRSWRNVELESEAFYSLIDSVPPVYVNGAVHWFNDNEYADYILSFDVENECFKSYPPPPPGLSWMDVVRDVSMGVLDECLCICDASFNGCINVLVMKEYGVKESWTKMFSMGTCFCERWPYGSFQAIKKIKNGAILLFHPQKNVLIYYHPEKSGFKLYKAKGAKSKFDVLSLTPSIIPLKDALHGDGVRVLNVYRRCGVFKVPGESRTFSLVQEDSSKFETGEDSDSEYMEEWDQEE